ETNSAVYLYGTTVLEGGVIVKSARSAQPIKIYGPITCQTASFRPGIFSCSDDDSIGSVIAGSAHTPSGTYALTALELNSLPTNTVLSNLRIAYAATGIHADNTSWTLRHSQFVNVATPVAQTFGTAN